MNTVIHESMNSASPVMPPEHFRLCTNCKYRVVDEWESVGSAMCGGGKDKFVMCNRPELKNRFDGSRNFAAWTRVHGPCSEGQFWEEKPQRQIELESLCADAPVRDDPPPMFIMVRRFLAWLCPYGHIT